MVLKRRPDGTYVRDLPPLRRIMPHVMRTRTESIVYFQQRIEVDRLAKLCRQLIPHRARGLHADLLADDSAKQRFHARLAGTGFGVAVRV